MNSWVFQANPRRYDVLAAASESRDDNWAMNQHRAKVRVGDKIYFYVSGAEAGIYATGRVATPVLDAGVDAEFGRWKVGIIYEAKVSPPVLRSELLAEDALSDFPVVTRAQGTNFPADDSVAEGLESVTSGRLEPTGASADPLESSWVRVQEVQQEHEEQSREALLDYLREIEPSQFERVVGALLEAMGYDEVDVVGRTGDRGVDINATLKLPGVTLPTVVQAKRWSGTVGSVEVRNVRGTLASNQKGLLVTTGRFSNEATVEATAPGKPIIDLLDGQQLVELLVEHGIGVEQRRLTLSRLDLDSISEL